MFAAAVANLVSYNSAVFRNTALSNEAITACCQAAGESYKYAPVDEWLKSKGPFPRGFLEKLPIHEDGTLYYTCIKTFVAGFVKLHFPSPEKDAQIVAFWKTADTTAMGRSIGLPPLTSNTLVSFLASSIFHVTATHELLGSIAMDISLPFSTTTRAYAGDHPLQMSVTDWYRIMCITTATTLIPVPRIIPEMEHIAGYWENEYKHPATATLHRKFSHELTKVSKAVAKNNAKREFKCGAFDPEVLEVSVSL